MPVKRHSTAGAVNSHAHGTDGDFARQFAFNADDLVNSASLSAGETELSLVA